MKYVSKDILRIEKYLQEQGLYGHVRLWQEKVSARKTGYDMATHTNIIVRSMAWAEPKLKVIY